MRKRWSAHKWHGELMFSEVREKLLEAMQILKDGGIDLIEAKEVLVTMVGEIEQGGDE